ncbi:LysR family transcriptional regulator [Pararoseomonas indoligenes]|uniref:LysR family transcriptional regulator n=1 Tax=Roseomonas indoligenes TaxID=2820811 RepID=A0A940N1J8_9PROT|nr:LysR family transcriptional regulator [Pararoseomonas indoligenes]MBP0492562.1 LysR family transcriptional regulator [Pararoseomonas indoligenes]
MPPSLRQARAFVSVVRLGSLTRAAEALGVSQPTLTVQLRQFEEALGLRLLDRGTRGTLPTTEGLRLAAEFERLVGDFDLLMTQARDVAAQRVGTVRLAALPSIGTTLLPRALARLRADRPGIQVLIRDAVARRVAALLRAGEVELAIGTELEADPELEAEPLIVDRMVAAVPFGHPLAGRRSVRLADFAGVPLILTDPESSVRVLVDRAFAGQGLSATPAYEVTYMSTALGLARAGLGVAILPSSAVGTDSPGLMPVPIAGPEIRRDILLIRRAGRTLSPAAEAFLAALRDAAGAAD